MSDLISTQEAIDALNADKIKRCRFEYINACKIVAHPTPDTSKNDIYDAYAVMKALYPIFGDEECEEPSAQPDYDKIIAEIKQCISETREHGKHHAKFVQDNGELYISGLEMALSIIEDVKNEKANIS